MCGSRLGYVSSTLERMERATEDFTLVLEPAVRSFLNMVRGERDGEGGGRGRCVVWSWRREGGFGARLSSRMWWWARVWGYAAHKAGWVYVVRRAFMAAYVTSIIDAVELFHFGLTLGSL